MEKYGKWSDRRSGLNPFLPPKEVSSTLGTVFRNTFGVLLSLVRIILLAPIVAIYAILYRFIRVLPRIPFVVRLLERIVDLFFARLILFLLGFFWISKTCGHTKKRTVSLPLPDISHGDLVFSNHISYIELLYLQYAYSPLFVTVPNFFESPEEERSSEDQKFGGMGSVGSGIGGLVQVMELFSFWSDVIHVPLRVLPEDKDTTKWRNLNSLLQEAKSSKQGPVILFFEGVTTNGKCVLQAPSILDSATETPLPPNHAVQIIGFKACEGAIYMGMEGFFTHTFHLCRHFSSHLEPVLITPSCVPSPPKSGADPSSWKEWETDVEGTLAQVLKLQKVTLSATDKISFLEFWKANH